jgi:hypothetical protein
MQIKLKTLLFCIKTFIICSYSSISFSHDLKIFGKEFCNMYNPGCINFSFNKPPLNKSSKYTTGKKAFKQCLSSSDGTDAGIMLCGMKFHFTEQDKKERINMCSNSLKRKYLNVAGNFPLSFYKKVWDCK